MTAATWLAYLACTAYLHRAWQRYEPTRVPLDAAAAAVSLPWLGLGAVL